MLQRIRNTTFPRPKGENKKKLNKEWTNKWKKLLRPGEKITNNGIDAGREKGKHLSGLQAGPWGTPLGGERKEGEKVKKAKEGERNGRGERKEGKRGGIKGSGDELENGKVK